MRFMASASARRPSRSSTPARPSSISTASARKARLPSLGRTRQDRAGTPAAGAVGSAGAEARRGPKPRRNPDRRPSRTQAGRPLSQDAKLVAVLRGAVEATAGDDGWAPLDAAGSAARRQAPIDPRNYGVRNFPKLFEATGLFEIVKADETGLSYVADKRNKDRTPKPRF